MHTELCVGVFGIQFCTLYLNKYGSLHLKNRYIKWCSPKLCSL